jgi:hypothetical protein
MGRTSKLTEKQWKEVDDRLRNGEKPLLLAKEYKISKSLVYDRLSGKVQKEKVLAHKILTVENEFKALPISGQVSVINFLDDLRAISSNLAGAARNGSMTAFRLSSIAAKHVDKIDDDNPMESQENLQAISALTKMTNDAASLGINLINLNKEKLVEPPDTADINSLGLTLVLNRHARA